jgi:hypothetical protein
MFVDTKTSHASPKATIRSYSSPSLVALVFALTINPNKIQAQIFDDVRINVPFQFYAGNTRHPLGEYRIHVLDRWDPTTLQISSADGQTSTLFQSGAGKHRLNVREERAVFVLIGMVLLSGLTAPLVKTDDHRAANFAR